MIIRQCSEAFRLKLIYLTIHNPGLVSTSHLPLLAWDLKARIRGEKWRQQFKSFSSRVDV